MGLLTFLALALVPLQYINSWKEKASRKAFWGL